MATRTQPEQQAPPVQRLRVRYAKRGRARFTSHRDFGRAFERALRRAGVPMAYSSGFSPHPRIAYANASPTGAASEAEYLEIGLSATCDPAKVRDALDAALPPGLDVVEVVPATPGALADLLTGSLWALDLAGVPEPVLDAAVARFLAADEVQVQRMTKNGLRHFDARAAVVTLVPAAGEEPVGPPAVGSRRLLVTLEHTVPAVRPDDVLAALVALAPEAAPTAPAVLTRLRQGVLDRGTGLVVEP
ncbi:radical SAM-linked protein [Friedmanniella luteola]|uniref:Radical SAM-linked protein n=1 Tax=Friedmanniella luteola TaxID=546871 RepID=A0A1H1XSF5_9ACTN|nr:TIGR03936 family radical SAM-associated protein [Friedmanniella luteola]SDT12194.1 radical SAM-linked protein [Friedmanniella luteola]